jgi:hypothetical protein
VVVLNFVMYSQRRLTANEGLNPLIGFAQINLTMWTIVVLPMYAALAAALLAALEHQGDVWKHLFAQPVSRRAIIATKWIAAAGLVLVSSLVLAAAVCAAAEILRALRPEWHASTPAALVMTRALQTWCAAGLLLSIQLWVSLHWRSFVAGLALAVVALLILLGGVARSGLGTIVVYLYPWALPPTAMARMAEVHADRMLVAAWGVTAGAIVAIIGCWRLSRPDTV